MRKETGLKKKKFLKRVYGLIILLCLSQVFHHGYNLYVVQRYRQGDYVMSPGMLTMLGLGDSYVSYYNQGNLLYQQNRNYEALASYQIALDKNPPEGKECSICINTALTYLQIIEELYANEKYTDMNLRMLYSARNVLMHKGCAGENGEGHSKEAEQLKEEIDRMIAELEERLPEEKMQVDTSGTSEEKSAEDTFEEEVKNKIRQKQSEANRERQAGMELSEEFSEGTSYDMDERIW